MFQMGLRALLGAVVWVAALAAVGVAYRLGAPQRFGRKIAWVAFGILGLYWISLGVLHSVALREVDFAAAEIARKVGPADIEMLGVALEGLAMVN